MDEHALETQRVEQLGAVVRPALDRVPLARARRGAVATSVEREQAEAVRAKAVVDEAEVVPAEETAAELEHDQAVLRPGQLVVELDTVVDPCVRHAMPPVSLDKTRESLTYSDLATTTVAHPYRRPVTRPEPVLGRARYSQERPTRSHATSLGSHSVLIFEIRRSTLGDLQDGHGGRGLVRGREVLLVPFPTRLAAVLVDRHGIAV